MNFLEYQKLAEKTVIFPEDEITYPFLGLSGEVGEVNELIKKLIRDNNGEVTQEFVDSLEKELGDVLWYIAAIARQYGLRLDDVAAKNIDKLLSRMGRGTLNGSGDDR